VHIWGNAENLEDISNNLSRKLLGGASNAMKISKEFFPGGRLIGGRVSICVWRNLLPRGLNDTLDG
jgi:hypothetical protein